jgi:hypothetical protein
MVQNGRPVISAFSAFRDAASTTITTDSTEQVGRQVSSAALQVNHKNAHHDFLEAVAVVSVAIFGFGVVDVLLRCHNK